MIDLEDIVAKPHTLSVTYTVTAGGQTRPFRTAATSTGKLPETARQLTVSVLNDVTAWLNDQSAAREMVPVPAAMVGRRKIAIPTVRRRPLAPTPVSVSVTATVTVGRDEHTYQSDATTDGNPFHAARALAIAAKDDLWSHCWDLDHRRPARSV